MPKTQRYAEPSPSSPDNVQEHVRTGLSALALGFLDAEALERALVAAFGAERGRDVHAFWRARLTCEQLRAVRAASRQHEHDDTVRVAATQIAFGGAASSPGPADEDEPGDGVPAPRATEDTAPRERPDREADDEDRYRPLRVIATGGAGEVRECFDAVLERKVATKSILSDAPLQGDPRLLLDQEARLTSSLEHPNIIPVYDAGTSQRGERYYVMRLVEQPSLEDILSELVGAPGRAEAEYPLARRLRHFIQVCDAVEYAHSRGVVHCDLKPANVMLGAFGEVLVVDWGLAYDMRRGVGLRGGTPGYMAPEQLAPNADHVGPRSDIFALGAILYELVCLEPALSGTSVQILHAVHKARHEGGNPITPPTGVCPSLPAELDAICMRALDFAPESRHPSARALAEDIEDFVAGTKEKERRRELAEYYADEGDELAQRYHEFIEQRVEQSGRVAELRRHVAPWDPIESKQRLWNAEDLIAVTESLRVRTLQAAVAAYEQSLDEVEGHPRSRCGLARLYRSELQLAQERRDELDQLYFEGLVRQYDDRPPEDAGEGRLLLESSGGLADLWLEPVHERLRRLTPTGRREPLSPADERLSISPGRYVVAARFTGGAEATFPVTVRPGRDTRLLVEDYGDVTLQPGEVLVPGGPVLLGDDVAGRLEEVFVGAFVMSVFPVTFEDYLTFVTELHARSPEQARRHLPRSRSGEPYWRLRGDRWEPAAMPRTAARYHPRRLPAFGIDVHSALAYAEWISEQTGRPHRLPTEHEWEKAARGTDGRMFPWGEHFDASFCKMRDSRRGVPMPEPVGAFAGDRSPYGVRDLAGSISEWVAPEREEPGVALRERRFSARGGAWCDWEADCRATSRRPYFALERSARLGFRLVREP